MSGEIWVAGGQIVVPMSRSLRTNDLINVDDGRGVCGVIPTSRRGGEAALRAMLPVLPLP
jgi:hypothetical protein